MHARSTTVIARPESIDGAIAQARDEVLPAVMQMDGCIGMSMMVDRETGRCVVTTAWESRHAMQATFELVRPLRERAVSVAGAAARPTVEEWEVAVMHRDHASPPGACVRSTWTRVDVRGLDRALEAYRIGTLPAIAQLPGFCSASLLIDRETGTGVSSVTFDGRAAMEATRDRGGSVRAAASRDTGAEILEVGEFDLVLAHLHVPELV